MTRSFVRSFARFLACSNIDSRLALEGKDCRSLYNFSGMTGSAFHPCTTREQKNEMKWIRIGVSESRRRNLRLNLPIGGSSAKLTVYDSILPLFSSGPPSARPLIRSIYNNSIFAKTPLIASLLIFAILHEAASHEDKGCEQRVAFSYFLSMFMISQEEITEISYTIDNTENGAF